MHQVNLRAIDLNLLVVLQELLESRHVTRAAQQLNMSQPAVSRALQRLRATFNDPLLVRTTQGYDLSARALEITPQLQRLMVDINQLVAEPTFDPASAEDVVRFYGLDLEVACFLPALIKEIRREAPKMHVEIRSEPRDQFEMLESGEVHFTITGMTPTTNEDQYRRLLLTQSNTVCLMGSGHPLATETLTLEKYINASHGLVSITGLGPGIVDQLLATLGLKRHVALRLPNFMTVAEYCETSDILFVLPEVVARKIAKDRQIVIKPVPKELSSRSISFCLYWHERHHQNPMCRWIRQKILSLKENS